MKDTQLKKDIMNIARAESADEEYAYDFVPVVDFRLDGIGI